MPQPFHFTDESGVVATDPTQPFYGIGLLKLTNVGPWNHGLNRILNQAVAAEALAGRGIGGPRFEFKFNRVNRNNYGYYQSLVDYFLAQPDAYFNAFVVDKHQQGINIQNVYATAWEALLGYSYQVINPNIRGTEQAIVISDYYQKPNAAPEHYEDYLLRRIGPRLLNVTMADSSSSMMLQLVDVLLGCVMYHYKRSRLRVANTAKTALADRLASAYDRTDLQGTWTCRTNPNYFSVWPFVPQAPA